MSTVLRRLLVTVVVGVALTGIALAFSGAERPEHKVSPGVIRVYPTAGDLELRQVKIGAILRPGYTGVLQLDGAEIPESDLYREPALYQVELRPEKGSVFADLKPGRHCAAIVYWPLAEGRQAATRQQWCFNLH
jgi:hypothetical protein